jgi:glycosyltransferase involved in cell wall biosynthesis
MIHPGLVTTIVPVHNRPPMLISAVESVLAQSHRPIEIVVVDDGSTDDTPAAADALAAAHPDTVRVLHVANGGPGLAREAGRGIARGEYLQYLDSDDATTCFCPASSSAR